MDDILLLRGKLRVGPFIELEVLSDTRASEISEAFFEVQPKENLYSMEQKQEKEFKSINTLYYPIEPLIHRIELLTQGENSSICVRSCLNVEDLFEVVAGPIIGEVTSTSARIFVEVNMDVMNLLCELRPTICSNDKYDSVSKLLTEVTANHPVCFHFTELAHSSVYGVWVFILYRVFSTFNFTLTH